MYPVFGIRCAITFLRVAEWSFGLLIPAGFWNTKAGVLGAIGSVATFIRTVAIIPFTPNGWGPVCRRLPGRGRKHPFPDEGRRAPRGFRLSGQEDVERVLATQVAAVPQLVSS